MIVVYVRYLPTIEFQNCVPLYLIEFMPCACVWTVDSETWLRNDPLGPYSCNLWKGTNVLFITVERVP